MAIKKSLRILVSFFVFFFLWQLLSTLLKTPVLPPLMTAFLQFFNDLIYHGLAKHLAVSFYRLFASILIGTAFAIPLGLFIGSSEARDAWTAPLIYLFYVIPKIILFPIFLILIGITDASKISLIALVIFFQVLVMTRDAAKEVDFRYIYSIKTLGSSPFQIFWHVFFFSSLPKIFTAIKISLGSAIAVLFLTETFATELGIGYYIMDGVACFNYSVVFSGVIGMGLLGVFLFGCIDLIERRLCPWIFLNKSNLR